MASSRKSSDRPVKRRKNVLAYRKRNTQLNPPETKEGGAEIIQLARRLDRRLLTEDEVKANLEFCSARLCELMRRDSMSNAALARQIYGSNEKGEALKQPEMSQWTRGLRMPGLEDILLFAEAFRVKPLSFLPTQQRGQFIPDDTCEFERIPGEKDIVRFLVNMEMAEEKAYRAYGILRDIRAE